MPERDRRHGLAYTSDNLALLHRAAWHGFRDDGRAEPWDPSRPWWELPSREWCQAFYLTNRSAALAHWEWNRQRLAAWPVAQFDPDPGLRAAAQADVDRCVARDRRLRRGFAPESSGDPRELLRGDGA